MTSGGVGRTGLRRREVVETLQTPSPCYGGPSDNVQCVPVDLPHSSGTGSFTLQGKNRSLRPQRIVTILVQELERLV